MYTNNCDGWISPVELDWLHRQAKLHQIIVELGSYRGRSATALCDGCSGQVFAVDIFHDQDLLEFQKNTAALKNLTVHRESSTYAANRFADKSVDMVFIDADHSYESVSDDIRAWLPKCRHLICGHDYTDDGVGHWPGVVRAVNEVFPKIEQVESLWAVKL